MQPQEFSLPADCDATSPASGFVGLLAGRSVPRARSAAPRPMPPKGRGMPGRRVSIPKRPWSPTPRVRLGTREYASHVFQLPEFRLPPSKLAISAIVRGEACRQRHLAIDWISARMETRGRRPARLHAHQRPVQVANVLDGQPRRSHTFAHLTPMGSLQDRDVRQGRKQPLRRPVPGGQAGARRELSECRGIDVVANEEPMPRRTEQGRRVWRTTGRGQRGQGAVAQIDCGAED